MTFEMTDEQPDQDTGSSLAKIGIGLAAVGLCAVIGFLVYRSRLATDIPHPYDDNRATAFDPELISHRETVAWPVGLDDPVAVAAAADGGAWVTGDRAVVRFAADGSELARWPLPDEPTALAVVEGTVHVALADHVRLYDAEGTETARWPVPKDGAWITAIGIAPRVVYLADPANHAVWRCAPDGTLVAGVQGPVEEHRGWLQPLPERHIDLVVDLDGTMWMSNPGRMRIEQYDAEGHFRKSFGENSKKIEDFCGCHNPVALIRTPDGLITAEQGTPRVKELSEIGELRGVVLGQDGFNGSSPIADLAILGDGRVAVLDRQRRSLRLFVRAADAAVADPPPASPASPTSTGTEETRP